MCIATSADTPSSAGNAAPGQLAAECAQNGWLAMRPPAWILIKALLMQRLESGAPRVHLDIHTDDLDAEVARLERLAAKRAQKAQT